MLPLDIRNIRKVAIYVRQIDRIKDVSGAIVECGVWKGKSIFILSALAGEGREVWGFDSFSGFTVITEFDKREVTEVQHFRDTSKEMVEKFLMMNGVKPAQLVQGPFHETLPVNKKKIGKIVLLHFDADLYDSYTACLHELYDQISSGGVIIFEEYMNSWKLEQWPGAAEAIDEFFAPLRVAP